MTRFLTHLISSIVARFIGSIWSMWQSILTTVLFKYSGIGNMPARNKNSTCNQSLLKYEVCKFLIIKHTLKQAQNILKLTAPKTQTDVNLTKID